VCGCGYGCLDDDNDMTIICPPIAIDLCDLTFESDPGAAPWPGLAYLVISTTTTTTTATTTGSTYNPTIMAMNKTWNPGSVRGEPRFTGVQVGCRGVIVQVVTLNFFWRPTLGCPASPAPPHRHRHGDGDEDERKCQAHIDRRPTSASDIWNSSSSGWLRAISIEGWPD